MEYNSEDIHILLIEKISGKISAADEALVDRLIREEPAVACMWASLQDTFATPAGREVLDAGRHEAFMKKVVGLLRQNHRLRLKLFRSLGYAALLLLLLSIFLFWHQRQQGPAAEPSFSPEVCLRLGNGRVISLTNNKQQIIALEEAYLRNINDTLRYTAGGSGMVNTLIVPPGKDYTLVLSDGTEIKLNAATTLSFPFTFKGNKREIRVNGEAYFKVARKAGQPFIVHTPQSAIEVLGTDFNVNTYNSERMTVSLLEGAVKIKAGNEVRILQPGNQAIYQPEKGMEVKAFDKSKVLAWLNGEYQFHDTPLQEIARVIPRWYGISVVLDNPAIVNKRFSGVMHKNKPLCIFLEHLQKTSEVRFHYKGRVLHFK
jgi:hypothetical protein